MTKLVGLSVLALGVAMAAPKAGKKVPQDLLDMPSMQRLQVIVLWAPGAAGAGAQKVANKGGKKVTDLPLIGADVFDMEAWAAVAIADDDDVVSVHPNRPLSSTAFSGTPDY